MSDFPVDPGFYTEGDARSLWLISLRRRGEAAGNRVPATGVIPVSLPGISAAADALFLKNCRLAAIMIALTPLTPL